MEASNRSQHERDLGSRSCSKDLDPGTGFVLLEYSIVVPSTLKVYEGSDDVDRISTQTGF